MQTVTAGDIAQRIKREDEDLTMVVDRVRNWVRHGLLKPIGARDPGTGRHRHFSERAIVEAAILNLLARDYGTKGPKLALFKGALDMAVKEFPKAEHVEDWKDIWLLIGPREGLEDNPSKPSHILSDIQYINSATRPRPVEAGTERSLKLPPLMGTRLLAVNLSSLFEKLGVPLAKFEADKEFDKKFGIERVKRG